MAKQSSTTKANEIKKDDDDGDENEKMKLLNSNGSVQKDAVADTDFDKQIDDYILYNMYVG